MKRTFILKAALAWAAISTSAAFAAAPKADEHAASYASHVYTQTNETINKVIHFGRHADGTLTEVERVATGGRGTSGYKILSGQKSAPDNLVSSNSIVLSPDNKLLFTVNAVDSSVSSFSVDESGRLHLVDNQSTGERGPPTSVAYNSKSAVLYVMHSLGPNHIRTFKVSAGKLALTPQKYSVNTPQLDNRVPAQIVLSPDQRFLLANVILDAAPPTPMVANKDRKDGLLVFPVNEDGSLASPVVNDAGGEEPFALAFLNGSSNVFVNTLAEGSGAVLGTLGPDGKVSNSPLVKVGLEAAPKGPSESCWVSISPDNRHAYVTNYGLGNITSFAIADGKLSIAADNQGHVKGEYKAAAGIPTSAPVDSWVSKDGYLYQLYPAARQLVAYKLEGPKLEKVGSYPVPYNSTVGLAGF